VKKSSEAISEDRGGQETAPKPTHYQSSDHKVLRTDEFSQHGWNRRGTIALKLHSRVAYFASSSTDADFGMKETLPTTCPLSKIAPV
jgi:hypothetical protein